MKVIITQKKLHSSSHTRGIGVYTRELISSLQKKYPSDEFVSTPHIPPGFKADLLHYPYFDPFFLTLTKLRNIPTVVTIHDLIPLRFPLHFPAGIKGKIKWFLQRQSIRRVAHIITDSECSKKDIIDLIGFDPDRVSVVPLGPNRAERVPVKMFQKILKSYHLPAKYLLYVGDLNWNKNISGLVKAFSSMKEKNLHLVLVGKVFSDKPDIPQYHELAKLIASSGKADKIIILGYVPSHHLSVIYSSATLYVQPSWYEGFGLPILEAMKFGCPVATSNRGSLPEIGGNAVAYFDPGKNMTETIESLLSSPTHLSNLSALGLLQAKLFTWERTAQLTHQVYAKVLGTTP